MSIMIDKMINFNKNMTSVKFKKSFLQMDVLCVNHYLNYILAGIGNNLFVYSNQTLLLSEQIFLNERIHSISIKFDLILLKGGRQLALVKLKEASGVLECQKISKIQSSDWVQAVVMLEKQSAGLVTAHNLFEFWDLETGKQIYVSSCEEKCILYPIYIKNFTVSFKRFTNTVFLVENERYSCKVIKDLQQQLVIFAGTVLGDVLIWSPCDKINQTLQTLKAHNGTIFSIALSPNEQLLATTSDDRSLKVWSISLPHSNYLSKWANSKIELVHTLFGHKARVWNSLILPNYYLTIGEDSQLIIWSSDGRVLNSLLLHQESGIRALDYSEGVIITGGEDGGINALTLNYLLAEKPFKALNVGQNKSTKVCFCKTGIVYTLNGSCVIVTEAGEEVVYKNNIFASYCVLEVSPGKECICLGSIKGHLVVIDVVQKTVVLEKEVTDGRIYSIHWLREFLLTCGSDGRLDLWKLTNEGLIKAGTMTLPNCKERWTTSAAVLNEKLVLGDRMGNLHVYKLPPNSGLIKTFQKIHSYLGVTDIKIVKNNCISIGRGGTVKEFTNGLDNSITHKLPMEWPWKIVPYNNDILILGFHSVSFIIWSMKDREVIASYECGGGHRSCDYKIDKNNLHFLYVKNKKVITVDLILDGITRIRSGFHGKEINCLKILQNVPIIVTGSEDTTVRITKIEKSELKQVEILKTHVSSVRAVGNFAIETTNIIVSVGGKGQMVIWEFDLEGQKSREIVNHRLKAGNRKKDVDPDTRIMCVEVTEIQNKFVIIAGCSDCYVRIFSYSESLNEVCVIPLRHCILNVSVLRVGSIRILSCMGTDGRIVFWDITNSPDVSLCGEFELHQSGINSFQFEELGFGRYLLATGGDDNLVLVAFVEVLGRNVHLRRMWENRTAHSSQITGIKILKSFLITISVDQRITVWKWSSKEEDFKVEYQNQYLSAVPDIKGMDAVWLEDNTIMIIVHGKGMEILNVNIN